MSAPRITAILQARMGSTRLPGKVLREVLGKPLLAYEIQRLRCCDGLSRIVLATTDQAVDDPVAILGRDLGADVFRGSEQDVLDRYYRAAQACGAEHVMRVTGDCPLLDPAVLKRAVEEYFRRQADYLGTSQRFAEGLDCELLSMAALETAWKEADRPSEREHVTLFMRNRPERFRLAVLENDRDDSAYRITVDEPQDFEVVRAVMEALVPSHGPVFGFDPARTFLLAHPEIMALNAAVIRNEGLAKSLAEEAGA